MSIEVVGPEKYLYQDEVCVELALRFWDADDVECIAEPLGGEDGELRVNLDGIRFELELQVKGASAPSEMVTLPKLAEYLAHFPGHEHQNFLLERLLANPNKLAVLICAQRAGDQAAKYAKPRSWKGERHRKDHILVREAKALLAELDKVEVHNSAAGGLKGPREAHLRTFAKTTDHKTLREALSRLILLEQWTGDDVRHFLNRSLRGRGIADDRLDDVRSRLVTALQAAKTLRRDAYPAFREIIHAATHHTVAPASYVPRGNEPTWVRTLSDRRVLLLSGPPRCGKSDAACWVAAQLEQLGYTSLKFGDLSTAERWLLEPGRNSKVAVLDDPLGTASGNEPSPEAALRRLDGLIKSLPPEKRLVVSQSQEPLLAATRAKRLSDVVTGSLHWEDLGLLTHEFLKGVWKHHAELEGIPQRLFQQVNEGLDSGEVVLDPGSLRHLAAFHGRLDPDATLDDAVALASESASAFAAALAKEPNAERLLAAIGIGSSAAEDLPFRELAFMLGAGGEPVVPNDMSGGGIFYGGPPNTSPPKLPTYSTEPSLDVASANELTRLSRHHVVALHSAKTTAFTHPYYRMAAQSVVASADVLTAEPLFVMLHRGLFSLGANASKAVAANLPWLHRYLAPHGDAGDRIIEEAAAGLNSYFPATRDLCFKFLMSLLPRLSEDNRAKAGDWIRVITHLKVDNFVWSNGEPIVPVGMFLSAFDLIRGEHTDLSEAELARYGAILDGDEAESPSPRQAVEMLKHYRASPKSLTTRAMGRFLSYDVGAIRADAVKTWLSEARASDQELLGRVLRDEHPSVADAALEGTLHGWKHLDDERRREVGRMLEAMANRPNDAAVMLSRLLEKFSDQDSNGSLPWSLFKDLLPIALRAFPQSFDIAEERLFHAVRASSRHLAPEDGLRLCEEWVTWLEREVHQGRLPDDYGLGICDVLLDMTRSRPELRFALVERLLAFPSTGPMLVFLCDLVDEWGTLVESERAAILRLLSSGRTDIHWLKAGAITRSAVPAEVATGTLPAGVELHGQAESLLAELPSSLVDAAVRLYCGTPQPLWWLGKHHPNSDTWRRVVLAIAHAPDHPLFEIALTDVADHGQRNEFEAIVEGLRNQVPERLFNFLLAHKAGRVGEWHRGAWDALLAAAPSSKVKEDWHSALCRLAPLALDRVTDLKFWLSEKGAVDAVLESLSGDLLVLKLLAALGEAASDVGLPLAQTLLGLVQHNPPRLHGTYSTIASVLKTTVGSEEVLQKLEVFRRSTLDQREKIKKDVLATLEPSALCGWVTP